MNGPTLALPSGSMPISVMGRVVNWPANGNVISPQTSTVAVMPAIFSPATLRTCLNISRAFSAPSSEFVSITMSERSPWMRLRISEVKPFITLLTTIIVATPSITLRIEASAM